jgi:PAS domain S-box-containing protein
VRHLKNEQPSCIDHRRVDRDWPSTGLAFAKEGAHVVASGRREAEGKELETELRSLGAEAAFIRADVRREHDVRSLIDQTATRFGRIDAAVNAAGTEGQPGPVVDQSPESYAATFDTNVLGTLLSMKHELRVMMGQGSGSIVNISSTYGHEGAKGASIYAGSKHAVEGITRSAALEAAALLAGEELSEEDFFPRQDGRIQWVRWSMKAWRTADARIGGAMLFAESITEQVEARRAFADSEARFRVTFENAPVGIGLVAPDGRWLRVNEAMSRILGYPAGELTTKSFQDITHPDDLPASVARVDQMYAGKVDRYEAEKRYLRKDGAIVWGRLTVGCVRKSDGSVDYLVTLVEDITARKQAEEELRKSEEQFRSSPLRSPLPVLLYDDREQILAVSQSWLEKTGYSREELRRLEDWTTRAYRERSGEVLEYAREIISTELLPQLSEMTIRTKDGHDRLWSFVCSALGAQSDGRRLFVAMAYDVLMRTRFSS